MNEQKFSSPEFEGGYQIPEMHNPAVDMSWWSIYGDVVFLALALLVGIYLVYYRRSRLGVVVLGGVSLIYFGFIRGGCVCPVGAVQNVVETLANPSVSVPLAVVLIFLLPLVVALFFGRIFCSGVCPLGAIQDIMVVGRPKTLPRWLDAGLTLIRSAYFWLAVLLAALGGGYIICRYDPFVGFFRLGGFPYMLIIGGVLLVLGVFVARPYCRYLCPYGLLLEWVSRFARWPVRLTQKPCVSCRLCAEGCPFDAIEFPASGTPQAGVASSRRNLIVRILLVPLVIAACTWLGWQVAPSLARSNPSVQLAQAVQAVQDGRIAPTLAVESFQELGRNFSALIERADGITRRFALWTPIAAFLFSLSVCARLVGLGTYRSRKCFEVNPAKCVACARCYGYCPINRSKLEDEKKSAGKP